MPAGGINDIVESSTDLLLNKLINTSLLLALPPPLYSPFLLLPSHARRVQYFAGFPLPFPAPPPRCREGGLYGSRVLAFATAALCGSREGQAGRKASRRQNRRRVAAGGSESLSVCEGRREQASEQAARADCSQHQQGPATRSPAPRPGRAKLGRARAMLLTVYCVRRDLSEVTFSLQVDADFELHNFRALCELESGIPAAESQVSRAGSGASLRS